LEEMFESKRGDPVAKKRRRGGNLKGGYSMPRGENTERLVGAKQILKEKKKGVL